MSKRKSADAAATEERVDGATTDGATTDGTATGGADHWAKTVVDGASRSAPPGEAPGPGPAEDTSTDETASDETASDETASDETATDPTAETFWVDEADETGSDEPVDGAGAAPAEADDATDSNPPADGKNPTGEISVEDLVIDLERVTTERDQYLDASRRLQAEFENYKKQVLKREVEARERANDTLVGELLPVLDAFDGAMANGAEDVAPMRLSFLDALAKQGLERIDPTDVPFDPTMHEAVMHEESSDTDGPVVAEVMRAGYVWKGRVLRPAMVRTRG